MSRYPKELLHRRLVARRMRNDMQSIFVDDTEAVSLEASANYGYAVNVIARRTDVFHSGQSQTIVYAMYERSEAYVG